MSLAAKNATLASAAPVTVRTGVQVQSVYATNAANTVISANIPADNTVPQNTEGTQVLTASITPSSAANYILIEAIVQGSELTNVGDSIFAALFRDSGVSAIASGFVGGMNGGVNNQTSGSAVIKHRVLAGSTTATTFTVRAGNNNGSFTLNATHMNINLGGTIVSSLTLTEVSA